MENGLAHGKKGVAESEKAVTQAWKEAILCLLEIKRPAVPLSRLSNPSPPADPHKRLRADS